MPETATESGPYTPAPWSPDFAKTAESIYEQPIAEARGKSAEASGQEQRILKERGEAMAPAIGQLEKGLTESRPPVPQRAVLSPPPSRQLHDFLAPVENQPPAQTVMQMISALTILGTGIGGLAKGDARAALSALTGALTGWKEGQRERADRAFADWQANTDALLKNSKLEWEEYYAALEDRKASNAEKLQNVQAIAMKFDNPLMAASAAKGDANTLIGQLMKDRDHIDNMETKRLQLMNSYDLGKARILEQQKRDAERAEDAKIREAETARHNRAMESISQQNADLRSLIQSQKVDEKKQGYDVMGNVLSDMDSLVSKLDAKGLLPKSSDAAGTAAAWARRKMMPNDPDWRQWEALQGAMVGYERSIYNDKGARALATYKSLLDFVDHPATAEGAHAVIKRMQGYLQQAQPGGDTSGQRTIKWDDIK